MTGKPTLGITGQGQDGKILIRGRDQGRGLSPGNTNAPAKCVFLEIFLEVFLNKVATLYATALLRNGL